MKTHFYLLILFVLVFACQTKSSKDTANDEQKSKFDNFLNQYHEESYKFFPLDATFAGDNRYNDLLPNNLTQQFRDDLKTFYSNYKEKLAGFDSVHLSESQQMSRDILNWELDINLSDLAYPTYLLPINQMWSMNLMVGQLAGGTSAQPFSTVKDYENWLKRVDSFVEWGDTAVANMKKGIEKGIVLPKSLIKKVIPQLESQITDDYKSNLFYTPALKFPATFTEDEKKDLSDKYKSMVIDKIIPLYKRLAKFMKETYLKQGRESSGISAFDFGKEYYQHQIKQYTTTDMTADEIFNLGKSEVDRILSEMEKVKDEVGYKGDIKSFFDYVRNKKELMPFTEPGQVIAHFEQIHETMKPQLPKLFNKTPKTPFEIRRTESFREASASAEYNQGSKDGTRPGIFYVPIPNAKTYNIYSDESLFLHEAIPGHHYQISLQQENDSLPEFRRTLWYSAYGEGWALYCESLGKELGLYTDPYQYFGMLSAEMHRAIRLVVDAGIHSKGWTREEAIQYSLDNEARSKDGITAEIERYMANPGQALSYKIGQLKIKELRQKAQDKLKDKFDIREFHDLVLSTGCIPLKLLENKVNSWIEGKRTNSNM